ncbi:hypothetical protein [Siminovitchia fordii]|uniref:Uncharacterized protein n=1 Tax=Siminovitchia fordii TaxID=254759 RepID=A0ABQ4KA02_9BACI|nr:hypothetical protein [Siminovitchia fordii]GIN22546.1 hypothetical protein J1TS3_36800 [Siminovitchia fordii]
MEYLSLIISLIWLLGIILITLMDLIMKHTDNVPEEIKDLMSMYHTLNLSGKGLIIFIIGGSAMAELFHKIVNLNVKKVK